MEDDASTRTYPRDPALQRELQGFAAVLALKESEDSWGKMDTALARLTDLVAAGTHSPHSLQAFVRSHKPAISRCILTERTKLMSTACLLVEALARAYGANPGSVDEIFLAPLLKLTARTKSVFVARAKSALLAIVPTAAPEALVPKVCEAARSPSKTTKLAAIECIRALLDAHDSSRLDALVNSLEVCLKATSEDANKEVRDLARAAVSAYMAAFPHRSQLFANTLAPQVRKALGINSSSSAAGSSRASSAAPRRPIRPAFSRSNSNTSTGTAEPEITIALPPPRSAPSASSARAGPATRTVPATPAAPAASSRPAHLASARQHLQPAAAAPGRHRTESGGVAVVSPALSTSSRDSTAAAAAAAAPGVNDLLRDARSADFMLRSRAFDAMASLLPSTKPVTSIERSMFDVHIAYGLTSTHPKPLTSALQNLEVLAALGAIPDDSYEQLFAQCARLEHNPQYAVSTPIIAAVRTVFARSIERPESLAGLVAAVARIDVNGPPRALLLDILRDVMVRGDWARTTPRAIATDELLVSLDVCVANAACHPAVAEIMHLASAADPALPEVASALHHIQNRDQLLAFLADVLPAPAPAHEPAPEPVSAPAAAVPATPAKPAAPVAMTPLPASSTTTAANRSASAALPSTVPRPHPQSTWAAATPNAGFREPASRRSTAPAIPLTAIATPRSATSTGTAGTSTGLPLLESPSLISTPLAIFASPMPGHETQASSARKRMLAEVSAAAAAGEAGEGGVEPSPLRKRARTADPVLESPAPAATKRGGEPIAEVKSSSSSSAEEMNVDPEIDVEATPRPPPSAPMRSLTSPAPIKDVEEDLAEYEQIVAEVAAQIDVDGPAAALARALDDTEYDALLLRRSPMTDMLVFLEHGDLTTLVDPMLLTLQAEVAADPTRGAAAAAGGRDGEDAEMAEAHHHLSSEPDRDTANDDGTSDDGGMRSLRALMLLQQLLKQSSAAQIADAMAEFLLGSALAAPLPSRAELGFISVTLRGEIQVLLACLLPPARAVAVLRAHFLDAPTVVLHVTHRMLTVRADDAALAAVLPWLADELVPAVADGRGHRADACTNFVAALWRTPAVHARVRAAIETACAAHDDEWRDALAKRLKRRGITDCDLRAPKLLLPTTKPAVE
ncbi:hypothetical protein H9P43_001465 [Blastocladiella emersonii ATCC 22665]|nr:hypothetical protein H9P43_001465 [Blastocladiella emersonii ATCC 22665]